VSIESDFRHKSHVDPFSTTKEKPSMSGLKVEALQREFFYNGTRIPDPAPNLSIEQVRELLTPTWPEIATATLTGPEDTGSSLRYTFNRAIGSKG
jgi:PRTRC genetic system protein C